MKALRSTIYEARLRKSWTQRQLAARSGVSVKTISRIENGFHVPTRCVLERLSRALDISIYFRKVTLRQHVISKKCHKKVNKTFPVIDNLICNDMINAETISSHLTRSTNKIEIDLRVSLTT